MAEVLNQKSKISMSEMNSPWRDAVRAIKKALFSVAKLKVADQVYRVTYEASKFRADRDTPVLIELAREKSCIFDVGANMGITSLIMASVTNNNAIIYSFEASEKACRVIIDNVYFNCFEGKIGVINALIAKESAQVMDFYWCFTSGGASIIPDYLGHKNPLKKITLALDDFVLQSNILPDLIKIDVEGAESNVLSGMKYILREIRPEILVELHSWEGMTVVDNVKTILPTVVKANYKMVYLKTKELVVDPNVFYGRGRCHVLLLPVEKSSPIWLQDLDTSKM
jgi:FkbM family methyltransferase